MSTNEYVANIQFSAPEASLARYKSSPYGRYGGGQRLIADLLAGTVKPIAVADGRGKKVQHPIECTHDERDTLTEMARAAGYRTRSKWIVDQLFFDVTAYAATAFTSSIGDWEEDDDRDVYAHAASSTLTTSLPQVQKQAVYAEYLTKMEGEIRANAAIDRAFLRAAASLPTRRDPIALSLAPDTRSTLEAAARNAGLDIETFIARRLDELARVLREVGC
ncbi:hypothetical protein ACWG8W_06420 [Citricoccus zhacaiensis]